MPVSHADEWQQPIRIRSDGFDAPRFLGADERVIFLDWQTDSAIVLFLKREFQLPEVPIALTPVDQPCSVGADVGWLGYPNIEQQLRGILPTSAWPYCNASVNLCGVWLA